MEEQIFGIFVKSVFERNDEFPVRRLEECLDGRLKVAGFGRIYVDSAGGQCRILYVGLGSRLVEIGISASKNDTFRERKTSPWQGLSALKGESN